MLLTANEQAELYPLYAHTIDLHRWVNELDCAHWKMEDVGYLRLGRQEVYRRWESRVDVTCWADCDPETTVLFGYYPLTKHEIAELRAGRTVVPRAYVQKEEIAG